VADICLVALNAKYIHASFGLRYLLANLGELRRHTRLMEFTIQDRALDMVEQVLAERPRLVGLGVYIWNAELAEAFVSHLTRVAPEVTVVLGGPEVSHEANAQPIVGMADYVIQGEGDLAFAQLARQVLDGAAPPPGVTPPTLPELSRVTLPYPDYDAEDVANRVVYVEASRGCPFRCEFCLSALDKKVRAFPLPELIEGLSALFARGVRHFKFVDRTFNLDVDRATTILDFFAERAAQDPLLLVHFEMVPDRLPEPLRARIAAFPAGVLQFEVGVQTFDPAVAARIDRRQDPARIEDNLRWLRAETGVHVHADLIVGLPGETVEGFGRGFDRLYRLGPQEIQVGILKRLRGAPIARHDAESKMVYSDRPPYQLLHSASVTFAEMQEMGRFARCWDLIANSGHYVEVLGLLLDKTSPFTGFRRLANAVFQRFGRTHSIAAPRLASAIFEYAAQLGLDRDLVGHTMVTDQLRGGRHQLPPALRPFVSPEQHHWIGERRRRNPAARRQRAFDGGASRGPTRS